ncbi:hypothetical protein Clacol_004444 [Clathrus columnatus]|uniref:Uncharacterized protein n=1 Tax=Clathrus columnatus TaxID=1419009 RepID=A0AAV5A9R8_9AGAM|nr:hypothetical protein Clacol_004444 [Clathrus columnatus]
MNTNGLGGEQDYQASSHALACPELSNLAYFPFHKTTAQHWNNGMSESHACQETLPTYQHTEQPLGSSDIFVNYDSNSARAIRSDNDLFNNVNNSVGTTLHQEKAYLNILRSTPEPEPLFDHSDAQLNANAHPTPESNVSTEVNDTLDIIHEEDEIGDLEKLSHHCSLPVDVVINATAQKLNNHLEDHLLHIFCSMLKLAEGPLSVPLGNFKESSWFKNDVNLFCKDAMMSPFIPAYKICGTQLFYKLLSINMVYRIPKDVIHETQVRAKLRAAVLSCFNTWRTRVRQKIDLSIKNKFPAWTLAKSLAHLDCTLTPNHVQRAAILAALMHYNVRKIRGIGVGMTISSDEDDPKITPVKLYLTGDFWTDIELFLLFHRKRTRAASSHTSHQRDLLIHGERSFYNANMDILKLSGAKRDMPNFIHETTTTRQKTVESVLSGMAVGRSQS